ncbi:MAG TPA: ADP-ribosylglycohydrolase family protein [Verrucomicrobiae bacterium]|nr:ADP-ribosylglycohydrolase family protein [Verrucomicrobiae bacterium]
MKCTPPCDQAIAIAEEARRTANAAGLISLHLLLGIGRLQSGIPHHVLKGGGVTADHIQRALAMPLTAAAKSAELAMARAAEEARLCDQAYLGKEHLFLALLAEENGPTREFFRAVNFDRRLAAFVVLRELGFETPAAVNTLLLLEDNDERVAAFSAVVREEMPKWELRIWRDAVTMMTECLECLESARLISLDHDLNPQPGTSGNPGTGLDIAKLLAGYLPFAPVIIHSTNADAAWSMHNDLRFAGWRVERVGPIGADWVEKLWLPKAREFGYGEACVPLARRSAGHSERMGRMLDSLEGLVIGDAVGEMLAYGHASADLTVKRGMPPAPWWRTDDGEMALGIAETLQIYGYVNQDALARRFAWRFELDPGRGYGRMTYTQLQQILRGEDWRKTAAAAFGGQGSMGNGGAMRVAPVGAYFAGNMERVVEEARRSALVTHTHPEGVAGAIAVAVAAATATGLRGSFRGPEMMFDEVIANTPESKVREGLKAASEIPGYQNIHEVAKILGNGSNVTAQDTAPYAIWCAAHHSQDYERAIVTTIMGGGDCDTNAAIVGGIVGACVGREGIPPAWREAKEKLPPGF